MTTHDSATPPEFYSNELSRALNEQGDSIISYRLTQNAGSSAEAEVRLLEDVVITLQLSQRGYEIVHQENEATVYESLEPLLESVSERYAAKRREALMERLSKLAAGQGSS